ncbi:protein of unknown function [Methylorubrum extorquens DM4]|uniref:Uncharacterized protein n=1 Tax=Methylorubrum extorquens (strain DSM 6343 / CIP 106787 / DM4) TaxID=661410 RepID=C7CAT8_METED|nr:hypothetical protein [Methylorubrum extorquens]CAX24220.1 protein of unknown function [Methylorubrum extorquens DM4]
MLDPNSFPRPALPKQGDETPDVLYHAVGRALTHWEIAEQSYATLFNSLVSPQAPLFALQRAYGSLAAARGRHDMSKIAAEVYFRDRPHEELEKLLRRFLKLYSDAGARRNELAHGIVAGHLNPEAEQIKFTGYYLGPSNWNSNKRDEWLAAKYLYNSKMIDEYIEKVGILANQAYAVSKMLTDHYIGLSILTE